ncbi:MAG: DUF1616 domain-containing protein [Nitrososphaerota archaeon]|nr:DUF1616 domain-containing protein [Nitrososphaerota archaeon]
MLTLKPPTWLSIILVFTALTLLVIYLLPAPSDDTFSYILIPRYIFAFIFIAFIPGYCLVKILFIGKNKLDVIEEIVLSVALSFGLTGLIGLLLGLSPIGINFTSIVVSLSILVIVLGVVAFIRKLHVSDVPNPS